ncbi:PepSY domain-containing protein [Paenibacillus chitinolyticus]|uniref:PepSY domain-containing protein n=1 Tax=Paenibacillus chitinolyticus TaxID=79263 RepID=A0A410X4Z5_9BACL|nr:PepSY domain-containing protein [Paenibacillus chitinolyticus]MCY9589958.1 PepSY domain-containing protein [Paenibacillus chitinolyticus]MCY9596295.1 PepSY domain-containing protein [Paenibacillus chitinolyticus]QAV21728.1 PepSY domain-containing protein [Paenibacillus chitinolyticus]
MEKTNYTRFWRWHFYAALFITPLLITLTLSGIGYLFYTNVENNWYKNEFFNQSSQTEQLTIDQGMEKAKQTFKDYSVSKVIVLEDPYNTRLTMTNKDGDQKYVFLDSNYQIVGSQNPKYTFSNVMREVHSSLFVGGTVVNYLVELAACWAIFLLLSGIYMTFKGRALKKEPNPSKRQKNLKWHALIGTIITIPMVIIIFTGLPWSALMGDFIYSAAQKYPSIGTPALKQNPPTSDISEIPWATRKNEPPASTGGSHAEHNGMAAMDHTSNPSGMIAVQQLMNEVKQADISKPYSIIYPKNEQGVYTVSKSSNTGVTGLDVSPYDEVTAYFDQYSGKLISKVGFEDYGILAKWFTWGIPLHEGHLFGWLNKVLNLVVCLLFLLVIFWGFRTWLTRKKKNSLSAPPNLSSKLSVGFIIFMLLLGCMMPLFGISLILAVLIEIILSFKKKFQNMNIAK